MMELSKEKLVDGWMDGRMDASIVEFHGAYRRMRISTPHTGRRRLRFEQNRFTSRPFPDRNNGTEFVPNLCYLVQVI